MRTVKIRLSPLDNLVLSRNALSEVVEILSAEDYTELNNAQMNLFNESLREIDLLVSNIKNLTLTSLHSRNIIELYLIMLHISSDRKALRNWYGQLHKDSTDIRSGFIGLIKSRHLGSSGLGAIKKLQDIQEFEDKSLEESPYVSKGPFNIKNLAEKYGFINDYAFAYKLCSKLIHPTSYRVNGYNVLTKDDKYLDVIIYIAVFFSRKSEEFALKIKSEKS